MGIILFNLMGTYWSFWLKIPSAKYIVIAWTFFLIGALVHAFRLAGLLPAQFWTMHALEFGSLLEIIAWGGALAHRYRCLYKQQEDKKQRLIQELIQSQALKERLNQALETKVVERTQELNQLNGNLLLKNQQLNDQQAILQKQKLKSDALNQLKDRLFSIISHDLRSPLNSLKSVLELIEQEDVSEVEFKELLPQINRNTHATVELLDNLLLWAKSQMHQVCVDKKSIDLSIITRKNIEFLALQAQAKQITIEARVQPGTLVFADEDMIALVVRNLISNAIKFTPQGGMITVETEQMIAFRRIAIKDTGVGMTAESLAQLFKAHNFSTRGTNNEKGTGLGLLLCQEFVEKNGGKIWAESIKGQGSTFYFLLLLPKQEFDLSNA
jgi:signal transduction histidine kinase